VDAASLARRLAALPAAGMRQATLCATLDALEDDLFALILDVASGRRLANNERHGYREIAIWKEGVTL